MDDTAADADLVAIHKLIGRQFESMSWNASRSPDWNAFSEDFIQGGQLFASARPVKPQSVTAFGPVNVLVANAGGAAGERSAFLDLTPADWQRMIDRNLTGSFHCGLAYGRHMRDNGGGSIVFTSSIAAEFAADGLSHYAAAKGGIRMLMRGMALELAPHKIRVNAVAPGVVLTPGNRDIITAPAVAAHFRELVPMERVAEPAELAGAVIYLASDEASYTTGATIVVDGGLTLL